MTSKYLQGKSIKPEPITPRTSITELIDGAFLAYNAARLREACMLFTKKMLGDNVTVALSLTGALTPAGLGMSALIPLIENGFVDWIVSTGANLYHDAHFAIGLSLHTASPYLDDRELRKEGVVRIYDIVFDYQVLLKTDEFFREIIQSEEFQKEMSTAEFHHLVGKYLRERERALGCDRVSLLSAAYEAGVPIYTSSPGDSSIGMNIAAMAMRGNNLRIDITRDVNETAALVWDAKRRGKSAIFILGGGSPKNFLLQTEPHIQGILKIDDTGHDYFLQITDARPDTGGLSGATPSEAISWGKIDPDTLPNSVICYTDVTIALPILTAYALANSAPRPLRSLYYQCESLYTQLRAEYTVAQDKSTDF